MDPPFYRFEFKVRTDGHISSGYSWKTCTLFILLRNVCQLIGRKTLKRGCPSRRDVA
jgi:hypothetical protein